MSDTIATDLVAAANDIVQLLRRERDLAEQERADHQTGPGRTRRSRILPAVHGPAGGRAGAYETGANPARRIIERSPSMKGDAP
jgi:hypothetical protein